MIRKILAGAMALAISSGAASALTSFTEGNRDLVTDAPGASRLNPNQDTANAPNGYDLGSIGVGAANNSINLHGRVVQATDYYNFETSTDGWVVFTWLFGGHDAVDDYNDPLSNPATGNPTFESQSGFIIESTGSNTTEFNYALSSDCTEGVDDSCIPEETFGLFTTTIDGTSGESPLIGFFAAEAGKRYTFELDGVGDAARYDINVSIYAQVTPTGNPIPLPAGVWLMGSALAGLGFASRRRRKAA